MRTFVLLSVLLFFSFSTFAQTYQLGHKTITYQDSARNNRNIPTELFYPAATAGNDVAILNDQFPIIVFGHGFVMANPDLYDYIWNALIPDGYIIAFPTTESSSIFPPPNHEAFGLDLAFLINKLKSEGSNAASFFYNHIGTTSAIMGHSMGGKATIIAAANNNDITTCISMGAAMSAGVGNNLDVLKDYAPNISVPSIVFSGELDCVAEPDENQIPLYDTLGSPCKTFISILGGGHCYFASNSSNCEIGEMGTCHTATREHQNQVVLTLLAPYLRFMLKNNSNAGLEFLARLDTSVFILTERDCAISGFASLLNDEIIISPNPSQGKFFVTVPASSDDLVLQIYNVSGKNVFLEKITSGTKTFDLSFLSKGVYICNITHPGKNYYKKIILN